MPATRLTMRKIRLPDWIGAHCRAFAFFNGVSQLLVPDNTKTGITRACFYEPDINPSYLDMAQHYGCAILPARVRKPRDKAKGEGSVLLVERWILAESPIKKMRTQTDCRLI